MADPYATRAPDLSATPAGPAPWAAAVAERGGSVIDERGDFDDGARFVVVHCRGLGILPPLARVDAAMATLLWLEQTPSGRDAELARALLGRLDQGSAEVFAIKQGWVGGPPERPGALEVDVELIGSVLDGLAATAECWEEDLDFGYAVPARVTGFDDADASKRALLPRLLYSDHDRVYEHARLVADRKRELATIAASVSGLDPRVAAAAGWPPAPTGDEWRD